MKIKYRKIDEFKSAQSKQDMANYVSSTVEAGNSGFNPYKPNDWDDTFWTVDSGNDWKIKFIDDSTMEVIHRYHNKEAIFGLATWVAYRTGGKLIDISHVGLNQIHNEKLILDAILDVNWINISVGTQCLASNNINELEVDAIFDFMSINNDAYYPFNVGIDKEFRYCIPLNIFKNLEL